MLITAPHRNLIHPAAFAVVLTSFAIFSAVFAPAASASAGNMKVTFVARECPTYASVTANRARNNIQESLQALGADTAYAPGEPIDSDVEALNQPLCAPIVGWKFTLGTGIIERAVTGPWGALSIVTNPFTKYDITTKDQVPLFNASGGTTGRKIEGADTIELNDAMSDLAARPNSLWVQGGTPTDPIMNGAFPGAYGFAALRCSIDNLNGDNVEWISPPSGANHMLCFAYYVKAPPTSGTIIVRKQVTAPSGTAQKTFRFTGNISYSTDQSFTIDASPTATGETSFYRAEVGPTGTPWSFKEAVPDGWTLTGLTCTSQSGSSTTNTDLATAASSVRLAAGDTVTCTYTDTLTPPPAGLDITKTTVGGIGTFDFGVTPKSGGNTSNVTATTTQEGVETAGSPRLSLPPADYNVTEKLPASSRGSWKTTSVVCNGQTVGEFNPLVVTLLSGQGTVCAYTNTFTPIGSIKLRKTTLGSSGTTGFVVSPMSGEAVEYQQTANTKKAGDTAVATGDETTSIPLGKYVIQETTPSDSKTGTWELAGVQCNGEPIASQQGRVYVTLTASHPDLDCHFVNQFKAGAVAGEVVTPDATPSTNLRITKRVNHKRARVGSLLTYTITVRNDGKITATNVTVAEQLARDAHIVKFPSGYQCRRKPFPTCTIGTLKPGQQVTLRVKVRATTVGLAKNRVAVNTAIQETSLSDNTASARVRVLARPHFTG